MHEAALSRAAFPAEVWMLGVPLLPYSLGHELRLIHEQNPLVTGAKVLPKDIFDAVWICSSTFDELQTARHRLSYHPIRWLLNRRANKCNLELATKAFREYRESGCLEFPISEITTPNANGPTPRPPGAPFILRLHQFVVSYLRLSESAAWDYPVGLAKMRWATHWEQEGGLNIYNYHDAEFDRFVREQEAKKGAAK